MNILAKNIITFCLVILAFFSAIVDIGYVYYKNFGNTETVISTNYIDQQIANDVETFSTEGLTDKQVEDLENRYIFEINVYENADKSGFELEEVKVNYFTSYNTNLTAARTTGMQYVGDYVSSVSSVYYKWGIIRDIADAVKNFTNKTTRVTQKIIDDAVMNDLYYCDSTIGTSYYSVSRLNTQMNRNQELIIKIDNKPYAISLTGGYTVTYGGSILKDTEVFSYNYGNLFEDLIKAVKTNSDGYGTGWLCPDLSQYFTVKSFDENGKKFTDDETSDIIKNYALVKYNYYKEGAKTAEQSMFNTIGGNAYYGLDEFDASYWSDEIVFTLSEKNLDYRYSEVYDGSFASLDLSIKTELTSNTKTASIITIDLNSLYLTNNTIKLIGLDMNAFENVKIETLEIIGDCDNFYLLADCLKNTSIKTIIHSTNLHLVNSSNSDITEVIK